MANPKGINQYTKKKPTTASKLNRSGAKHPKKRSAAKAARKPKR